MKFLKQYWGLIIFSLSVIAIFTALSAEYFFNLAPCKMCLHQRYPYYFIIIIFAIFFFYKKITNFWLYILIEISILYGLFYSIWHVGIEKNIFEGLSSCADVENFAKTIEDLKKQIISQDIVNCSDTNWLIFGYSAATVNTFLLLLLLF